MAEDDGGEDLKSIKNEDAGEGIDGDLNPIDLEEDGRKAEEA